MELNGILETRNEFTIDMAQPTPSWRRLGPWRLQIQASRKKWSCIIDELLPLA